MEQKEKEEDALKSFFTVDKGNEKEQKQSPLIGVFVFLSKIKMACNSISLNYFRGVRTHKRPFKTLSFF
jgi:hypothetical protein